MNVPLFVSELPDVLLNVPELANIELVLLLNAPPTLVTVPLLLNSALLFTVPDVLVKANPAMLLNVPELLNTELALLFTAPELLNILSE